MSSFTILIWTMILKLKLRQMNTTGNIDIYTPNGAFHLISLNAINNSKPDPCCKEPFDEISYEMRLKRRPTFYVVNFIFPSILITAIGKYHTTQYTYAIYLSKFTWIISIFHSNHGILRSMRLGRESISWNQCNAHDDRFSSSNYRQYSTDWNHAVAK
jgi:hypothetical protein